MRFLVPQRETAKVFCFVLFLLLLFVLFFCFVLSVAAVSCPAQRETAKVCCFGFGFVVIMCLFCFVLSVAEYYQWVMTMYLSLFCSPNAVSCPSERETAKVLCSFPGTHNALLVKPLAIPDFVKSSFQKIYSLCFGTRTQGTLTNWFCARFLEPIMLFLQSSLPSQTFWNQNFQTFTHFVLGAKLTQKRIPKFEIFQIRGAVQNKKKGFFRNFS